VGDRDTFLVDDTALGDVARALGRAGVRSLVVAPPSLEELFLRHYDVALPPAGAAVR
jgi:ABC-2 type transport system ATP-binding protein